MAAGQLPDEAHQLLESVFARAGEVVAPGDGVRAVERFGESLRNVAHVYRLEASLRVRNRDHGEQPSEPGKKVEEPVFRPEHHGGAEHGDVEIAGFHHGLLAPALGALVLRGSVRRGAERAHVNESLHAAGAAGVDERGRQLDVRFLEVRAVQHADQINHRVVPAHELMQHPGLENVGFHYLYGGQKDQVLGALAAARRHGELLAAAHELGGEVAADET